MNNKEKATIALIKNFLALIDETLKDFTREKLEKLGSEKEREIIDCLKNLFQATATNISKLAASPLKGDFCIEITNKVNYAIESNIFQGDDMIDVLMRLYYILNRH